MIETELKRHQQSVSTRSSCCVTWNADDRDDGVIADFDFEDSARYHRVLSASYDITLILPLLIAVSSIVLSMGPPKQRERCDHMLRILPFSPPAPSNPLPFSFLCRCPVIMQASAHAPTITQAAAVETFTKVCRPTYQTLVIDQGCDAIC